jgi:hypothetical protein
LRNIIIDSRFEHLRQQFENIETLFDSSRESIHKARNELRVVTVDDMQMVIKAFRIPNLLNRVVYAHFRPSKASKSYHNALRLIELGIATPLPVAYIEDTCMGLFNTSFFISLYEPYDFTIREALHHNIEDYEAVLKAFTAFTYELHNKGVWHEDYSPGNILVTRQEHGYRFSLVDINRMKFMPVSPEKGCENFAKLWAHDEDLRLMAEEYARSAGMEAAQTFGLFKRYARRVVERKAFKQKLKKLR